MDGDGWKPHYTAQLTQSPSATPNGRATGAPASSRDEPYVRIFTRSPGHASTTWTPSIFLSGKETFGQSAFGETVAVAYKVRVCA